MKHSNHKLTYIELHPEPLDIGEPHPLTVVLGAFGFAALMYVLAFLVLCL